MTKTIKFHCTLREVTHLPTIVVPEKTFSVAKKAEIRGTTIPVHRCKECPFVEMGDTRWNWTCQKTGTMVPLNLVYEGCPLEKWEEVDSGKDR